MKGVIFLASTNQKRLTQMTSAGGWGAKLGPGVLSEILSALPNTYNENLIVGFDTSDDAAVYKINDDTAIIQTVDFFPPIVDDPFTFGQIAAANAISDVYAMGGTPTLAMNIICIPNCLPLDTIKEILRGGYEKAAEAGITIVGGHSIQDPEPKSGLCVTGFVHPDHVLPNSGCKPGEVLVLTKPIGTGVLSTAYTMGILPEKGYDTMVHYMSMLNKYACEKLTPFHPSACTDVTGFGLLGHLVEMAEGSKVSINLYSESVPLIEGVKEFAEQDIFPAGTYVKGKYEANNISEVMIDLLCDPQTSGGLLASMSLEKAQEFIKVYPDAVIVGDISEKKEKSIYII